MDMDAVRFTVLLAEDDPVSREFLREAIRAEGATVTDCADGDTALALARAERFDLLILDHQLPGRNGDAVLATLRADASARSRATAAIATSAAGDTVARLLLGAGFAEVLPKPMDLATLHDALRRHGCGPERPLDDADALRACGSPDTLARLRRLFAEQELPKVQGELDRVSGNLQRLRPTLHRLRASCGFCGARGLARASAALHLALATGADEREVEGLLARFRTALEETRAALRSQVPELQSDIS